MQFKNTVASFLTAGSTDQSGIPCRGQTLQAFGPKGKALARNDGVWGVGSVKVDRVLTKLLTRQQWPNTQQAGNRLADVGE